MLSRLSTARSFIDRAAVVEGRIGRGVVVRGNVFIGSQVRVADNVLIQAFPGRKLSLTGDLRLAENVVVQAGKRDLAIVDCAGLIDRGAFIKDVALRNCGLRLEPLSEVKEVSGNETSLSVGERAFLENVVLTDAGLAVPLLSRFDGKTRLTGTDVFGLGDRSLANSIKLVRWLTGEADREGMNEYLRPADLLLLHQWGVNLISTDEVKIGPEVKIGRGTTIYPGVTLAGQVLIGEDCTLYPNTWISAQRGKSVMIGNNNNFYPGTSIIAQNSGVLIGSDCEVGIGGATLVDTSFGNGVSFIGHSVARDSFFSGNNHVACSLVERTTFQAGTPDNPIDIRPGSVAINSVVGATIFENTRVVVG